MDKEKPGKGKGCTQSPKLVLKASQSTIRNDPSKATQGTVSGNEGQVPIASKFHSTSNQPKPPMSYSGALRQGIAKAQETTPTVDFAVKSDTHGRDQSRNKQNKKNDPPTPAAPAKLKLKLPAKKSETSHEGVGKIPQPAPASEKTEPISLKVNPVQPTIKAPKATYSDVLKQVRDSRKPEPSSPKANVAQEKSPPKSAALKKLELELLVDKSEASHKEVDKIPQSAPGSNNPELCSLKANLVQPIAQAAKSICADILKPVQQGPGKPGLPSVSPSLPLSATIPAVEKTIAAKDSPEDAHTESEEVSAPSHIESTPASDDAAASIVLSGFSGSDDEAGDKTKDKASDEDKDEAVDGGMTSAATMISADSGGEPLVTGGSGSSEESPQPTIPSGPPDSVDGCGPISWDLESKNTTQGRLIPLIWTSLPDEKNTRFYGRLCRAKPEVERMCTACTGRGTSHCGACKARYCSVECRNKDWPLHKRVCKEFARLPNTQRPSKNHFAALFLPSLSSTPQLVHSLMAHDGYSIVGGHPEVAQYAEKHPDAPIHAWAYHVNGGLGLRKPFLGHGLAIVQVFGISHTTANAVEFINQAIHSLAQPGALRPHMGPFILMAFDADERGIPTKPLDVTPADWKACVEFLVNHAGNPVWPGQAGLNPMMKASMGAKVNCLDHPLISQALGIKDAVESVMVPTRDCTIAGPAALPFQVGLPWKARYTCWEPSATSGPEVKYLDWYFGSEPSAGEWKARRMAGCLSITILSMADDRCVHSHHVRAFQKYMDFSLGKGIAPSREGMMKYWDLYRLIHKGDLELGFIASPYSSLPKVDEISSSGDENPTHARAVMNLLGHFDARGWVMDIRKEEGGSVEPYAADVEYDTEGTFKFSKKDQKIPSGVKQHFF